MENFEKFSFSISKLRFFEFCKRAYYFRYILSRGGWDKASPQKTREIYSLKNLIRTEQFLSEVLKESFKNYLKQGKMKKQKKEFYQIANIEFYKLWNRYYSNFLNFTDEGKNKMLLDIFYSPENSEELHFKIFNQFKQLISLFVESTFFKEYSNTQYLYLRDLNEPEQIEIGGIPVFTSPFLLKVQADTAEVSQLFLNNFKILKYWDISASLLEIFTKQKTKSPKITVRSIFLIENKFLSVWASRPISEIKGFIKEKSEEILYFENNTCNLPEVENKEKCKFCEFRKLCI
ncbi:MAG TPA: hypothetical protein P5105_00370 [Victivallales bacterium]|nr:hypothetical protein [Victivallales bacterium]HRR05712.1 hypothetical protein [Victivallales bacterium]HRU00738.1 hypothetical protein [Victivallales bacterium]